jgi:hypothetical protein
MTVIPAESTPIKSVADRQLVQDVQLGGKKRTVEMLGFGRRVDVEDLNFRNPWFRDSLKNSLQVVCKLFGISVDQIIKINSTGIQLKDGRVEAWKNKEQWTTFVHTLKSSCESADQYDLNPRVVENRVDCRWAPASQEQTQINQTLWPVSKATRTDPLYSAVKAANNRFFGRDSLDTKDKLDSVYRTTLRGLVLGQRSPTTSTYEAAIVIPESLRSSVDQKIHTYQHLALNSEEAPGVGINSSNDRKTTKTTNLRQVCGEAESHYYTGRIAYHATSSDSTEVKERAMKDAQNAIEEQVKFMYLSEVAHGDRGKGIKHINNEIHFTFAVQSLLSMGYKLGEVLQRDAKSFEAAKAAYESMKGKSISFIGADGKPVNIVVHPIKPFATEFNFSRILQLTLPHGLTGYNEMNKTNTEAEIELKDMIDQREPDKKSALIQQTFDKMKATRDDPLKQILYRAYLFRLLGIPQVIHCKSSLDRTGSAGSAVCAMNQYLDLCRVKNGIEPELCDMDTDLLQKPEFRELAASNLIAAEVNGRLSRGESGLKIGTFATPEVLKLMPDDCLIPTEYRTAKRVVLVVLATLVVAVYAAAMVGLLLSAPFSMPLVITLFTLFAVSLAISKLAKHTSMQTWHGKKAILAKILFVLGVLGSLPGALIKAAVHSGEIIPERQLDTKKLRSYGLIH